MPAAGDEHRTLTEPDLIVVPRLDLRIRNSGGTYLLGWRDLFIEMADVAAFVWRQVDGTRTISEIASLVAAEYEIDVREAAQDVGAVLTGLAQVQFIRLVPRGQPVSRWY